MSVLQAREIAKRYRGKSVVDGVSLTIHSGEIVGLLGPNGAGKTTSFYMIVGLIRADDGFIRLEDEDITKLPMHVRARRASAICLRKPQCSGNSAWKTTSWASSNCAAN